MKLKIIAEDQGNALLDVEFNLDEVGIFAQSIFIRNVLRPLRMSSIFIEQVLSMKEKVGNTVMSCEGQMLGRANIIEG